MLLFAKKLYAGSLLNRAAIRVLYLNSSTKLKILSNNLHLILNLCKYEMIELFQIVIKCILSQKSVP